MTKDKSLLFRRLLFTAAGVLVPTALFAGNFTLPHTFASNTPAKASDVNENFSALATALNKTTTFLHVSTTANTAGDVTCLDNPFSNGDANALLTITRVWGNTHSQAYITSALSVFYDATAGKWCIFREDAQSMPVDVAFNVTVVKP